MEVKIIVAHHKQGLLINNDVYCPIQVGKENSKIDLGIHGDNEGDGISHLNPIYCEMTAVYWGWKNLDADYLGLCHYRRYLTFKSMPFFKRIKKKMHFYYVRLVGKMINPGRIDFFQNQLFITDPKLFELYALDFSIKLKRILEKKQYDVIVPTPFELACTNVEQHFMEIGRDHVKLLKQIVMEQYCDFTPYLNIALTSHKLYSANLFVMRKELYDEYCKMIFDVLNSHVRRVKETNWCYDPLKEKCYSRVSGYLAEIMTSAYIIKIKTNKGNILYVNSMFLGS